MVSKTYFVGGGCRPVKQPVVVELDPEEQVVYEKIVRPELAEAKLYDRWSRLRSKMMHELPPIGSIIFGPGKLLKFRNSFKGAIVVTNNYPQAPAYKFSKDPDFGLIAFVDYAQGVKFSDPEIIVNSAVVTGYSESRRSVRIEIR